MPDVMLDCFPALIGIGAQEHCLWHLRRMNHHRADYSVIMFDKYDKQNKQNNDP
jgi:hypothetical protein